MEKYKIPSTPRYRVEDMRKLQDRDPVIASLIMNPTLIEPILESIHHVRCQVNNVAARIELIIPKEGWQADAAGGVFLDMAIDGVTEEMTPVATFSTVALETVRDCELSQVCETLAGAVRFRAVKAPGKDMEAELLLVLPLGEMIGGEAPGSEGLKGEPGEDALTYSAIHWLTAPLEASEQTCTLSADSTKFNRAPNAGDSVVIVCAFENRSWIVSGHISETNSAEGIGTPVTVDSFVETTGLAGGGSGEGTLDHTAITTEELDEILV